MPKVLRQVEQEVSITELNADLKAFAATVLQDGAFLPNADGTKGEIVNEGDVLVPSEATYASGIIAADTYVHVIKTLPEAGIIWGVHFRPDGQKAMQFFVPQAFASKHVDQGGGSNASAKTKTKAKTIAAGGGSNATGTPVKTRR